MDIELQDKNTTDVAKMDNSESNGARTSMLAIGVNKILEVLTSFTGLDRDCLFATLSYYLRLVIWTAFLYFYVGGIGAIGPLYTLRAILGYIFLLAFLVVLRLYYLEYYEILKWFATPSLVFLKSWTSLFFFAYLVLLPSDLKSVRFDQIISWIFQVGFGNILALAVTVLVINCILWIFSLFIPKEDTEAEKEKEAKKHEEKEPRDTLQSEAEEVAKDFKPSISTIPSSLSAGRLNSTATTETTASAAAAAAGANSAQRRESTMSSLSVGLRPSFAADAALGRMSLQAYGEAKYLQYALSKGSQHCVDEVGATIHEDEFDKKQVRLSMKQAIYGTYNLAEMKRPATLMRGSSGNLGSSGIHVSNSGNNISGLADVNRESIVVKKNNTRLVMIHNMDFDGAARSSLSLISGDRTSLSGVRVRPVTGRFKPTQKSPASPKAGAAAAATTTTAAAAVGTGALRSSGSGGGLPVVGPHSMHNTLHTTVRPKSVHHRSPQSSPQPSPQTSPSSEDSRKHADRPLPALPPNQAGSSSSTVSEEATVNPLTRSLVDPASASHSSSGVEAFRSPPPVLLRGLSKQTTLSSGLEVIEEGEDEDRVTEIARTKSINLGSSGVELSTDTDDADTSERGVKPATVATTSGGRMGPEDDRAAIKSIDQMDDYEMEYPDEALADQDAPQEEEISIALPFIPTMQQLFTYWQYVAVLTALITYLMPSKTHGSVVAFQLACSILAFIVSTTYRTRLLGSLPVWLQMPLQSFVIFTPIVIIIVILTSTEGVHNWQACLQQYIVIPNGIVRDLGGYGAGNYLVMFLNPAIVSLAFSTVDPIIEYYQLLPLMIPAVVISCLVITIENAAVSRMLASPSVIARPLLIRTVTIPIAIEITTAIQASTGITVATVLVNAVLALRLFPTYLTYMKVNSPVTRGISCGLCGTLLGVVSLDDLGETVAAGIGMAGFGIATISFGLIMTFAEFRDFVSQLS